MSSPAHCIDYKTHEIMCRHKGERTRLKWIDGCQGSFCDECLFALPHCRAKGYRHLSWGGAVEYVRVDSDGIPLDPSARSMMEVMCAALLR